MSVVLNTGGRTYKHKEEARTGDLWIGIYNKTLICVTNINDNLIYYQPMTNEMEQAYVHTASFYSLFQKYESFERIE